MPTSPGPRSFGVTAAGQPIPESLIFGVGGGPGAGYILWEFETRGSAILTLGFQNNWQYTDRWLQKTLDRFGVRYLVEHTGGAARAARRLTELLDAGRPCIVRPERYNLGYWGMPSLMDGCGSPNVVVYAQVGDRVHIDDRNVTPLTVSRAILDTARARVGSYKNSLYAIDPLPTYLRQSLRAAVQAGLDDCVDPLSAPSDSFRPRLAQVSLLLTPEERKAGPASSPVSAPWPAHCFPSGRASARRWYGGPRARSLAISSTTRVLWRPPCASPRGLPGRRRAWQRRRYRAPDDVPALAELRAWPVAVRIIVDPSIVTPEEAARRGDLGLTAALDRDFPLYYAATARLSPR